jgi:hypothetical protein
LVFRKGTTIKTISSNKNILAEATITEDMPQDFGIYDLNKFLTVLSLHKEEPELEITPNTAVISGLSGRSKIDYRFCDPEMINSPSKPVKMPDAEINFELSESDLEWVLRTAAVLGSPNVAVTSDGTSVNVLTFDTNNDSESTNTITVGEGNGNKYKMIFKTEALKMIPGSYTVAISSSGVSHFKHKVKPIQYWIATESGSTFTGT